MPFDLPDPLVRPGEPALAGTVNALGRVASGLAKARPGPGVRQHSGPRGKSYSVRKPDIIKARLTASLGGGKYAWQEVYAQAGGGWVNGYRSGSSGDPAYEFNLTATLTVGSTAGLVVDLERNVTTNELRFQMDSC